MKKKDDGKLAEGVRMAETLDTLGTKVDELSTSVDKRFEQVDKRFEDVDRRIEDGFAAVAVQFAEQRADTEFAYGRLEKEMAGRFDRLERKLDQVLAVPPRRKRP
jgi:tetrahydromethanopterin S-methyltransferase subunit G